MGENLENVITLEPVGNQMVDGLLALDGGDAGGAILALPNNGALMARCFHCDLFLPFCVQIHRGRFQTPSNKQFLF